MSRSMDSTDVALEIIIGGVLDFEDDDSGSDDTMESDDAAETRRSDTIAKVESLIIIILTQLETATRYPRHEDIEILSESDELEKKAVRRPGKVEVRIANRQKTNCDGTMGERYVRYPKKGRSGAGARPVAQLYRVLELMHEALVANISMTKRDIYYRDPALFRTQSVVDKLVDDLAATFAVSRSDLNIRATLKGLVCGSGLVIHLCGEESVDINDTEGTLIPVGEDISTFELDDDVCWILIVEKAAVFQTLCQLKLTCHPSLPGRGIMITGKGYPDIATRELVKTFSDNLPPYIPIIALVDGDAYGIDILAVYKFGSYSMRHEKDKLAAPRLDWMGIRSSELSGLRIDKNQLIPMTLADEKKAFEILRRPGLPASWRKELTHMIFTRRKAEIEILSSMSLDSFGLSFPSPQSTSPAASSMTDPDIIGEGFSSTRAVYPDCDSENSPYLSRRAFDGHPLLHYVVRKIREFISNGSKDTDLDSDMET